jgi:hypothetical protein
VVGTVEEVVVIAEEVGETVEEVEGEVGALKDVLLCWKRAQGWCMARSGRPRALGCWGGWRWWRGGGGGRGRRQGVKGRPALLEAGTGLVGRLEVVQGEVRALNDIPLRSKRARGCWGTWRWWWERKSEDGGWGMEGGGEVEEGIAGYPRFIGSEGGNGEELQGRGRDGTLALLEARVEVSGRWGTPHFNGRGGGRDRGAK